MTEYPSYLLDPPPVAPVIPAAQVRPPGWLRRNRWGLVALLPLLAGLVIVYLDRGNAYERYWQFQPRIPVAAGSDGWASFADAKIRLVELSQLKDLRDFGGKPVTLPAGLQAWQAILEFDIPDQKTIIGCQISLEDQRKRLYETRPAELSTVRQPSAGCTADDETLNRYQTTAFFVTPRDSRPTAVRITRGTNLPRYARLTLSQS